MATTKVFMSGNSQAVRLPKSFQLDTDEVEIYRRGKEIVLRPKNKNLSGIVQALGKLSSDFMDTGRLPDVPQKREAL